MGYSEDEATELYILSKNISEDLLMSINDATISLSMVLMADLFTHEDTKNLLNSLCKKISNPTIPQLKKRIKYSRNPMEEKKLQQELNEAYKEQKRKR